MDLLIFLGVLLFADAIGDAYVVPAIRYAWLWWRDRPTADYRRPEPPKILPPPPPPARSRPRPRLLPRSRGERIEALQVWIAELRSSPSFYGRATSIAVSEAELAALQAERHLTNERHADVVRRLTNR